MDLKITKSTYEDAKKVNKLLTKLIVDEKKYDENINENCVVKSLYENFYNNDDVCLLVAKEKEHIIGYIYGYVQNNGDAKIDTLSVLDALYVEQDYRRLGVGIKLIDAFKNWSYEIGAKYIELKVCKENNSAINLYEKMGFTENKIIMVTKLRDNDETF